MKRWALLSVYEKRKLESFARALIDLDFEIFASTGTYKFLKSKEVEVSSLNRLTDFDEMFEGRVKTLHPNVFAPILARSDDEDMRVLAEMNLNPFDVVAVNLYPFMEKVEIGETGFSEAVEEIDIGGVALLRASAKASDRCYSVLEPEDYDLVIEAIKGGKDADEVKLYLASKTFAYTSQYDAHIARYFHSLIKPSQKLPRYTIHSYSKLRDLRYGENPHQNAGLYSEVGKMRKGIILGGEKLSGKEVSFNNIIDMESAYKLVSEFSKPACAYIKHTNPCGCAISDDEIEAVKNARSGDPISAFGGIVSLNRPVDERLAKEIVGPKGFLEAIIAPSFTDSALDVLRNRKGWGKRLIIFRAGETANRGLYFKDIDGGLLIAESDDLSIERDELRVMTRKGPGNTQLDDMLFAYTLVKYIKSNAIVIVRDSMLIGMGAGQPNRLTAVQLAIEQAEKFHGGCYSAVLASDAFFPMPDAPELAVEAGVEAIIQPGGSKRDDDVIRVMDKHGVSMVFTGIRHFLH